MSNEEGKASVPEDWRTKPYPKPSPEARAAAKKIADEIRALYPPKSAPDAEKK